MQLTEAFALTPALSPRRGRIIWQRLERALSSDRREPGQRWLRRGGKSLPQQAKRGRRGQKSAKLGKGWATVRGETTGRRDHWTTGPPDHGTTGQRDHGTTGRLDRWVAGRSCGLVEGSSDGSH